MWLLWCQELFYLKINYTHRCEEDVKINVKLWKDMEWYLNELYDTDQQAIDKYIDYVSDKMQYISDQQFLGLRLDNELCVSSLTD